MCVGASTYPADQCTGRTTGVAQARAPSNPSRRLPVRHPDAARPLDYVDDEPVPGDRDPRRYRARRAVLMEECFGRTGRALRGRVQALGPEAGGAVPVRLEV